MQIRDYVAATDFDGLRACVIEIQDYEHRLDPRIPDGPSIVDEYVPEILRRCVEHCGKILVADFDGEIAGYAMVWTRVKGEGVEDGDFESGYLADLIVLRQWRGKGVGRALTSAAETYAKEQGVECFRIGVMASNHPARALYSSLGYSEYVVELEKYL